MKKLILALLLAVLLPACALATTVEIAGVDLTAGGSWRIDITGALVPAGDDAWVVRYDPASDTLTLDGLEIKAPMDEYGLMAEGDLKIVLINGSRNTITGGNVPRPAEGETWNDSCGIHVNGDLVIEGDGTLTAVGAYGGCSYGIIVIGHGGNGATLTVSDVTVKGEGGMAGAFSKGIYSHQAMTATNAVINAKAGESGYYSYRLDAGGFTAENSTIAVTAGRSDFHSLGVYTSMNLTNCLLAVAADVNSPSSNALAGNLTMQGGQAEFVAGKSAIILGNADGLSLSEELEISGSATYDGELGEVTLPEGKKEFLSGDVKARRILIKAGEAGEEPVTPTPTPSPAPSVLPTPPATGDGAHPALWLALLTLAGAAAMMLRKRYK
ncbi:MAG: carbohydrate-binding domain-containing protein [Clostridia bacterium]|nr:carbohydrate-binding domain-containing protein [Clostridia bacterium]